MDLLKYIATLLGSSGTWISFSVEPHCRGAVGNGTTSLHCHTAGEQWIVYLPPHTASLLHSGGQ